MVGAAEPTAQRAAVSELLESWSSVPAFLRDRHLTIVSSNRLARAVSPAFAVGMNLARTTFLDASVHHSSWWKMVADQVAAELRDSLDRHEEDSEFYDIVGELSALSRDFATAWADESLPLHALDVRFPHASVGPIVLRYQQLGVPGSDDVLVVWRAIEEDAQRALSALIAEL